MKLYRFLFENEEPKKDYIIYFDMDGVLADFEGGVKSSLGYEEAVNAVLSALNTVEGYPKVGRPDELNDSKITEIKDRLKNDPEKNKKGELLNDNKKALKKAINTLSSLKFKAAGKEGFFENLNLLPMASEMLEKAKRLTGKLPNILTAPIESSAAQCEKEKENWMKKNFNGLYDQFFCTANKGEKAAPNAILIDDREKYIRQFEDAGGIGILHTGVDNTLRKLESIITGKEKVQEKRISLSKLLFEGVEELVKYETVAGDPLPHHVSLTKFKPYGDPSLLGKEYELKVNGVVIDQTDKKVIAVGVTLPDEVTISTGKPAHITVGLFEGGKPVNSGDLNYSTAEPLSLTVKTVLVNATDNKMFAEEYLKDPAKLNNPKGNAQLVLSVESHKLLKDAVNGILSKP